MGCKNSGPQSAWQKRGLPDRRGATPKTPTQTWPGPSARQTGGCAKTRRPCGCAQTARLKSTRIRAPQETPAAPLQHAPPPRQGDKGVWRSEPGRRRDVLVHDEALAHVRGWPALQRSLSRHDEGLDAAKLLALGPDVMHTLGELGVAGQRLLAEEIGEADHLGGPRGTRAAASWHL